jgi:hypothetical protein
MKSNDPIEVTVETVAEDGCAYTADGSHAVFGALPGEKVVAVPVARKRKRLYLRSTQVLTSSPRRVTPMCKAASFCGGCSFQHVSHAYQLELKQAQVQQAFGQMESMQSTIRDLQSAKDAVVNGGASTGIMQKWIPSFDAATSEFRAVANRLGIAVINSATFGALSEKELQLAMETGFPRDLSGPELIKWIDAKIDAQTKMKNALYSKARSLTSGIRYSEFIQAHGYKDGNNPNASAVDPIQAAIDKKRAGQ